MGGLFSSIIMAIETNFHYVTLMKTRSRQAQSSLHRFTTHAVLQRTETNATNCNECNELKRMQRTSITIRFSMPGILAKSRKSGELGYSTHGIRVIF
jgi:hypothetical protein